MESVELSYELPQSPFSFMQNKNLHDTWDNGKIMDFEVLCEIDQVTEIF